MKTTMIKILALTLVTLMLVGTLAACGGGGLSGSYEFKLEAFGQSTSTTYTFSGNKVTASTKTTLLGSVNTVEASGTYKITDNDDGTQEISFDFAEDSSVFSDGTYTFEKGDSYISIGGIQYTKK